MSFKRTAVSTLALLALFVLLALPKATAATAQQPTPTPIWHECPQGGDLPDGVMLRPHSSPPFGQCVFVENTGNIMNVYDVFPEGTVEMVCLFPIDGWRVYVFDQPYLTGNWFNVHGHSDQCITKNQWGFEAKSMSIARQGTAEPLPTEADATATSGPPRYGLYLPVVYRQRDNCGNGLPNDPCAPTPPIGPPTLTPKPTPKQPPTREPSLTPRLVTPELTQVPQQPPGGYRQPTPTREPLYMPLVSPRVCPIGFFLRSDGTCMR